MNTLLDANRHYKGLPLLATVRRQVKQKLKFIAFMKVGWLAVLQYNRVH